MPMDKTIGWAAAVDRKRYFVTAQWKTRFLRPLMAGASVAVRGRVLEHRLSHSSAEGGIIDESVNVYAKATGEYIFMAEDQAKEVHNYLTVREVDTDFLCQQNPFPLTRLSGLLVTTVPNSELYCFAA
jgi:acyl-CoA thioesterase FadM